MTSSPDATATAATAATTTSLPDPDATPPGLRSMWRLLKLGYRNEPMLLLAAFVLALLAALPDALLALAVTIGLLMSISPGLVGLGLFARPTVLTSTWRPGVERLTEEQVAQPSRLAKHLFMTATTAPPGKEVRVTQIGERLVSQR